MNAPVSLWRSGAHAESINGSLIRARLPHAAMGELCEIRESAGDRQAFAHGVIVGLDAGMAAVSLLGDSSGLTAGMIVLPTGDLQRIEVSTDLLGCVLDGFGRCVERFDRNEDAVAVARATATARPLASPAVDYRERRAVDEPFSTGVRAIDALLTCGVGQRVGVFAAAGSGKTTLAEMLVDNAKADVYVIALVGERGREVASFVDRVRASGNAARTVIVQSTSDTAPAARCSAAMLATTVAEYFRDEGGRVMLIVDSMTRYARALRDIALAAGEPPARRGYPASVFEALPRLVERPGRTHAGSITAFYTVLLEDEESADPIGEEIKSLLDGHIHLSAKLATRGHHPAIDVLRSNSRLFTTLASAGQQDRASRLRATLGLLEDMQLMRDLGEYKPGSSAEYDAAVAREPRILGFLRQARDERADFHAAMGALDALAI